MQTTQERISGRLVTQPAGCLLFVEANDDDFVQAGCEIEKLKVFNPVQRVGSVKQMLHYLGGVDQYADRDRFPLPALIVVAMHLPDGDCLSAQAMIRSNITYREVPLIIVGRNDKVSSLRAAAALGAAGYLIKPFSGKEFVRVLLGRGIRLQVETIS